MLLVAVTEAAPLFVARKSASPVTTVMAVSLLLFVTGSLMGELLEARFVSVAASAGALKIKLKLVPAPFVSVAMVGHVTTPLLLTPPPALTIERPGGNASLTTTLVAV